MDPAVVAARARTENFPVASLLFPRALRPHLRAVYGFARLVDILGDEAEGDRLALLDELEREVEACYTGHARLAGDAAAAADDPRVRPAAGAVPAADRGNRIDQRKHEYETWADVEWYCDHSADPVGRLVLGLLRRADDEELVAPRTTSAPGSSSSTSSRTCRATSSSGGSTCRRRTAAATT